MKRVTLKSTPATSKQIKYVDVLLNQRRSFMIDFVRGTVADRDAQETDILELQFLNRTYVYIEFTKWEASSLIDILKGNGLFYALVNLIDDYERNEKPSYTNSHFALTAFEEATAWVVENRKSYRSAIELSKLRHNPSLDGNERRLQIVYHEQIVRPALDNYQRREDRWMLDLK